MKTIFLSLIVLTCSTARAQINWESPIDVSDMTYGNRNPKIVLDNSGDPIVSWGNSSGDVYVSSWSGSNFNTPVIANSGYNAYIANNLGPDLASKGDTVYIVFKAEPVSSEHVYVARSFDGGLTFDLPVQVDDIGSGLSEFVHLAADDNGHPIVIFNRFDSGWSNPRWVLARSNDFGGTFQPDVLASNWSGGGTSVACECCPAAIATKGDTCLVAYRDNYNNIRDTWVGLSFNGGISFIGGMDVDQSGWYIQGCPTTGPDIEIQGDTVYSTFMNAASGQSRVFYSKASISAGNGASATIINDATPGLTIQNYPRISTDQNYGVIAWQQTVSGQSQVVVSTSLDLASGFPASYSIVDGTSAYHPDIVIDGTTVHLVWRDSQSSTVKYCKGQLSMADISNINLNNLNSKNEEIFDLMGRKTTIRRNEIQIIRKQNGEVEKRIVILE